VVYDEAQEGCLLMKAKMLWSEADRMHKMMTIPIKKGKLHLPKTKDGIVPMIDVDKVPQSTIEYADKILEGITYVVGGVAAYGASMVGGLYIGASVFAGTVLVAKQFMKRPILYPFYMARWNSCTPLNPDTAKPSRRFSIRRNKKEVGTIDFVEVKLKEPADGIEMYTPENYSRLHKATTLATYLKGTGGDKLPWPLLLMMIMVGFFVCAALFPNGIQAAIQAAQSAATPAAAPPG
jgi:hypothetical protein